MWVGRGDGVGGPGRGGCEMNVSRRQRMMTEWALVGPGLFSCFGRPAGRPNIRLGRSSEKAGH